MGSKILRSISLKERRLQQRKETEKQPERIAGAQEKNEGKFKWKWCGINFRGLVPYHLFSEKWWGKKYKYKNNRHHELENIAKRFNIFLT